MDPIVEDVEEEIEEIEEIADIPLPAPKKRISVDIENHHKMDRSSSPRRGGTLSRRHSLQLILPHSNSQNNQPQSSPLTPSTIAKVKETLTPKGLFSSNSKERKDGEKKEGDEITKKRASFSKQRFISESVINVASNAASQKAYLREMAVKEFIETETTYVKDLAVVMEEFYAPMKSKEILPKEVLDQIFLNIDTIASLHKELEKDLRARGDIATTFQKMTPFLKMYNIYCAKGTMALEILIKHKKSPAVEKFLSQCMSHESARGQPLESYLIKPTQRLCKYPLLFQTILSNTEAGNEEYAKLEQVLEQIKAVVAVVNERKREVESLQKIEELKSQIKRHEEEIFSKTKIFIKEGELTPQGEETLTFCLFDDLLLATKPKKKKNRKEIVYHFNLDQMLIKDVVKVDDSVPKTSFDLWTFLNGKKTKLRLTATNNREKNVWISSLEKAATAKCLPIYETFLKTTADSKTAGSEPQASVDFDTWYQKRQVRLFGEFVVLRANEEVEQLKAIRQTMQQDLEAEELRHEQEDEETNILKLRAIIKTYNTQHMKQIAYFQQLDAKLKKLEHAYKITKGLMARAKA